MGVIQIKTVSLGTLTTIFSFFFFLLRYFFFFKIQRSFLQFYKNNEERNNSKRTIDIIHLSFTERRLTNNMIDSKMNRNSKCANCKEGLPYTQP